MNFNTFYNKILTDENMMETIRHSTSAYPFRFYYDNLALFDFHCIEWHWHVEFEFVYVEKGTAMFWVGENAVSYLLMKDNSCKKMDSLCLSHNK